MGVGFGRVRRMGAVNLGSVGRIILRCLQKDFALRPSSMRQVAAAFPDTSFAILVSAIGGWMERCGAIQSWCVNASPRGLTSMRTRLGAKTRQTSPQKCSWMSTRRAAQSAKTNPDGGVSERGLSRSAEQVRKVTVRREVPEETELVFTSSCLPVGFGQSIARTHVFAVEVNGEVRGSWEGEPRWVSLSELSSNIYLAHRPVLTLPRKSS